MWRCGVALVALLLPLHGAAAASAEVAAKEAQLARARAELRRAEAELAAALEKEGRVDPGAEASSRTPSGSTCNARIWSQDPAPASAYLERQHRLRAPYYIRSALRSYTAGLLQAQGKDKSNDDPFIKWHEGVLQLLGALDLAPDDPEIWRDVGKATVTLGSLSEDASAQADVALSFFSQACRMRPSLLPEVRAWLQDGSAKLTKEERQMRKKVFRKLEQWSETGIVDDIPVQVFPSLTDGSCSLRGRRSAGAGESKDGDGTDGVARALLGFQLRSLFPTRVLHTNVLSELPPGFEQRLSDLCVRKYGEFATRFPGIDPNDLNDKFFSYQITSEKQLQDPAAQRVWPEMYHDSEDFKLLLRLMSGALKNFLPATGLAPLPGDDQDYATVLWAAVYPGNGGRHGYHVHQNSISSCVLYLRTAGATTPITFVDPRGAPPLDDYERHVKERDWEPVAPFHHSEYFFPEAGDLVCFPSWLVHTVPSHWENTTRVAFAANLQAGKPWDSWHRTVVGWS